MSDVARRAQVSAMTVSRVVNESAHVDDATRERVWAAIVALQYQVNRVVRSTRKRTVRIGLLYGRPGAPFMSDFLVAAMDQCELHGVQLILEKCGDLDSQRAAIAKLIDKGVDCILVPPPLGNQAASMRLLDASGVPIVAVASAPPAANISTVSIDDYQAAQTMMEHLLAAGHRDIAFIRGDPSHAPAQLRYQAYLDAINEAGMRVRADRVAEGGGMYRSGLAAADALLGRPGRPTAIFASNEDMAAAVVAVAHGLRLRVPADLAVCGFDDTASATLVWPELTAIHWPIDDMARTAVRLAIEAVGEPTRTRHSVLPYSLVARASTAIL